MFRKKEGEEKRKIDESILSQNPKQKTSHSKTLLDDNTRKYSGKDKFNVGYIVCDPPDSVCPTIRVLSPLGKLSDKIFVDRSIMQEGNKFLVRKDNLYKADIILIQRTAFLDRSIAELKSPCRKIIYEIDDLLIEVPASNPNRSVFEGFQNKIIDAIKGADAVTVSTNALKERLSVYNRNIYVLPNYIDIEIWGGKVSNPAVNKDKLVIAFIGTPTHQEDISMITPAIKKVIGEYGDKVMFRFFGCITKELLQLKGVEFVSDLIPDYRAFARYMKSLNIDIALAPLVNNSFNECKSNIKFLEYSICSIPGIYSRITPYASSITDGKTGVLCDDDQGNWYKAMVKLIENEELRRQIAECAHGEVLEKYTLEANAYRWYDFYRTLIEENTHRISVITTKKGNLSLRVTCEDGSIKTLHSLYDPEAEARSIVDAFQFDGSGILVVLGLGLGYHLKELVQRFPEAEIVVVEAMPEIYEMAMQHGMISGLEGRIEFVVGFAVDEAISKITSQQMKLGMVSLSVFSLSSTVSAFQDYYSPILTVLRNTMNVKLWDRLRYPKFREDVCSVALIDFGYFLTREIEAALRSVGHRVIKVPVSREESGEVIVSGLIKKIYEFKPDFIITINHLGLDEDGVLTSFLESIEMPVASWYVDSPNLIVRAFDRNVSPYVSLFLWDRGYIKDLEDVGFESVTYLPLATDETVFKSIKKRKRPDHYQCDVSFVGNSRVVPALESLEKIPGGLYPLVEKMALLLSSTRMPFDAVLATLEKKELSLLDPLSVQERLDFEAAILWRATLIYRLSCIKTLKDFHPRIRGDEAWKKLLGNGYTFGAPLNYYNELPAFYNASKINFNATSLQMLDAVNQRVFDVPACGAFLLTDHQDSIEELFDVGKEIVVYRSRDEIPELVRFYLRNPKERENIARRGRERILKEHTYRHRLDTIIQNMKNRYG
ncbi:MAG: glycosyltransferase [Nitrospirota bacterium]|nr:glycosyltransferase [Nitrospirota bacterium]